MADGDSLQAWQANALAASMNGGVRVAKKVLYAKLEIACTPLEQTDNYFVDVRTDQAQQEVDEGQTDHYFEDRRTKQTRHRLPPCVSIIQASSAD